MKMSYAFMFMKAEFTLKHLGLLDLMVVDGQYQKTLLARVDLKGHHYFFIVRIQSVNVIHNYVYDSWVHHKAFRSTWPKGSTKQILENPFRSSGPEA